MISELGRRWLAIVDHSAPDSGTYWGSSIQKPMTSDPNTYWGTSIPKPQPPKPTAAAPNVGEPDDNLLDGAVQGAATGAVVGGPVGAAVGAGVGFLLDLVS